VGPSPFLGENKMKTNGISAVTLFVGDMKKSFEFYSKIPGFTHA